MKQQHPKCSGSYLCGEVKEQLRNQQYAASKWWETDPRVVGSISFGVQYN